MYDGRTIEKSTQRIIKVIFFDCREYARIWNMFLNRGQRRNMRNIPEERGRNMDAILWLAAVVVLLVIEIATLGLTTIWFAGGALIAGIAAVAGAGRAVTQKH